MPTQKVMRHRVDIFRKPRETSLDARGQLTGDDVRLASGVPCFVNQLQANELTVARQQYASATHNVQMYADPNLALNEECYLKWGSRRLDIGGAIDPLGNDLKFTLLCGEVKT